VDEEEDQRYGKGKKGDELPKELAFRESRLKKIQEAKAALEAEAHLEGEKKPDKKTEMGHRRIRRKGTSPILTPTSCQLPVASILSKHTMPRPRSIALTR